MEIREIDLDEYSLMDEFIYWAIYMPAGQPLPDKKIIYNPDVFRYIEDFGQQHDCGVVAEVNGEIVGMAWARIISGYGSIDADTPELAISVLPTHRSQGIGSGLMRFLFSLLKERGYNRTSLAVQKENPAVRFYHRLGYYTKRESPEEFIMLKLL